jgi:8-oxo-dGTP pyrophosphatase MutT (NUDIX family)
VWDLPGGHVEDGEVASAALVRELREELGIVVTEPADQPIRQVRADKFDMQIWLVVRWEGTPVNAAADEHDAIAWFHESELAHLRLAHDSYRAMFADVLAGRRS